VRLQVRPGSEATNLLFPFMIASSDLAIYIIYYVNHLGHYCC